MLVQKSQSKDVISGAGAELQLPGGHTKWHHLKQNMYQFFQDCNYLEETCKNSSHFRFVTKIEMKSKEFFRHSNAYSIVKLNHKITKSNISIIHFRAET